MHVIQESMAVGVITVLIGLLFSYSTMRYVNADATKKFNHWNSVMVSLFITGVAIHLTCEFTGINKWYCANGAACARSRPILRSRPNPTVQYM